MTNITVVPVVAQMLRSSDCMCSRVISSSAPNGSFVVNCLEGSVGVLPLEGANGMFLQVGQAVNISPQGELSAAKQPAAPTTAAETPSTPPVPGAQAKKSHTGWIILALVGGGAAGAGAALGGKKGSQPVSP